MLLVLSHGQAAVEKDFSINKQAEEVHLQVETVVAKRIICDHHFKSDRNNRRRLYETVTPTR